jgi:glyceraldehyde 3-phosphate dehydrogenase
VRVPTPNVSLVDLVVETEKPTSVEAVNAALKAAAEGPLQGILNFCEEPLVSIDFNGHPASSSVDAATTSVIQDTMVKVMSWYDNEWGYSNRIVDLVKVMAKD